MNLTGITIPGNLPPDVHERVVEMARRRAIICANPEVGPLATEAVRLTEAINRLIDPHRLLDTKRHRRARERMAERRALGVAPKGKHGENGYANYGCRCDECRAGKAQAHRRRARQRERREPPEHGLSGYNNYHCRCDVCCAAKASYMREYVHRRAASP